MTILDFRNLVRKDALSSGIFFILIALLFTYLIIVPREFPFFGLAVSFATLSTLVYFSKERRNQIHHALYFFLMALSFCILLRSNGFLTFLNIISVILLGSFLTLWPSERRSFGLLHFFTSPFALLQRTWKTPYRYFSGTSPSSLFRLKIRQDTVMRVITSVAVTALSLLIVVPLLASANPLFERWVGDFLRLFQLEYLFEKILSLEFLESVRNKIIFFLILAFLIPKMIRFSSESNTEFRLKQNILRHVHFLFPKILISAVLFLFFLSQVQLYFANDATLQALGYTHSQYAREVFAQLSIVALVIFGLIYLDPSQKKNSRMLTFVLVLQAVFLAIIAFKSVYDYSSLWGFTQKRLWGFTGVFWILSALGLFAYSYLRRLDPSRLILGLVFLSSSTLLAVNLVNFDWLIYNHRQSSTQAGPDHLYLSRLSADSLAYGEELEAIDQQVAEVRERTGGTTGEYDSIRFAGWQLANRVQRLQEKYQKFDLRTWNVTEYMQYQKVRSVDVQSYFDKWQPIYPPVPPPQMSAPEQQQPE